MVDWRNNNREYVNRTVREKFSLKTVYGLSQEQYKALLDKQDGKCAICRNPFMPGSRYRSTRIDHVTGTNPKVVRGLLCHGCNLFVGYLEKRRDLIGAAFAYIWPKGDR